ncbi:hypothetical protein FRC06_010670 [Ceratobasidium sp. 370]|nr:hypothetical protein FRC06_010670 [Ceratobasidium sp. 370]
MHQPGCTERAQYILAQAMRKGKFRWGTFAERVAGASICVALREAGKAETVREVAVHIQCREDQLARVYRHITSLLNIKFEPLDPALLVPSIWNYTQSCLTSPPPSGSPFPPELIAFLNELAPRTQLILNLALQLSNLILSIALTQGRQPPLIACALLIVSLSGEAGKPVPKSAVLSSTLSARFGGTRRSITDRVREIERVIEDWRLELPWMQSDIPLNRRKRTTKIAKWIKDVVSFKDDLWSKQIDAVDHALYSPSTDDASNDEADDDTSCTGSTSAAGSKRSDTQVSSTTSGKRRCLDAGYYDSGRPRAYVVEPLKKGVSRTKTLASLLNPDAMESISTSAAKPDMLEELGRLGAPKHIRDEDLFEDGELEGLIRTTPEVEALSLRWEEEKRFEGIPERTEDLERSFLGLHAFDDAEPPTMGEDGEEVIGEWRDVSPPKFDDSYYYEF